MTATPIAGGSRGRPSSRAARELDPTDDRAIVRDNRPLGYPTLSTLICVASLSDAALDVHYGEFARPRPVEQRLAGVTRDARVRGAILGDTPDVTGVSRGDCAPNPAASGRGEQRDAVDHGAVRAAEPSSRKCPNAGTRTFVAPSRALPSGMCGSYRAEDRHDAAVDRGLASEHHDRLVAGHEGTDAGIQQQPGAPRSRGTACRWRRVREGRAARSPAVAASGAGALAAASPASPPATASITAAAAAPDVTSRCLPMSPPLLCATMHAPGGGRRRRGERAGEPLGGLGDAAAVDPEPVHDAHAVARGAQGVAQRAQERPVLVHAGKQHDLGQAVGAGVPRRRAPAGGARSTTAAARTAA